MHVRHLLPLLLATSAAFAAPAVTVEPRGFTITTPRLSATIRDGVIVTVKDLKTGELHADAAVDEVAMPRGLGHMAGNMPEMQKLHSPWGNQQMKQDVPPGTAFPTMHWPAPDAKFATSKLPTGLRATWTGLMNATAKFPAESLTLDCWVDASTGQLLFKASASSPESGIYGVQVPLANLHPDHRMYVASFGGVMYDRTAGPGLITLGGTPFWEAPLVAIEGRQGSLGLWIEDATFKPSFFFLNWTGKSFSTAIESLNYMPYEQQKSIESPVWHLDAFPAGGWVDALTPYKQWYAKDFAPEMKTRAATKWADKIRVIVDHATPTDDVYRHLALTFDPETVLIHDWNARAPEFDHELPDWTPRAGYVDKVRMAHKYGFHTMAYVNTYCANYKSPVWQRDKLDDFALLRSYPGIYKYPEKPLSFADIKQDQLLYLDPLSPRWRQYHTDMMLSWRKETGTDANYEDVGGTAGDFGNGTIGGLTGAQGGTEQFRELLRRNPEVPMASEYAPDHMAFAVRWPLRYQQVWGNAATRVWWMEHQRPISAYIHGPLAYPWIPIINAESDFGRNVVVACSDALGGMAQLMATPTELEALTGMAYHMKRRAQLFAHRQLTPAFPKGLWASDLSCVYADRDGRQYKYTATPQVQRMNGPDGHPVYERITGLSEFDTPLTIPGWPAGTEDKVMGLNPEIRYALSPGRHDRTKVQIQALPSGIKVSRYESTPQRTVLALTPTSEGPSFDRPMPVTILPTFKPLAVLINDKPADLPVWDEKTKTAQPVTYTVTFPAYLVFVEANPAQPKVGESFGEERQKGRYIVMSSGLERGGEYVTPHFAAWPTPGEKTNPNYALLAGGSEAEVALDYLVRVPGPSAMLKVYLRNTQTRYGNSMIGRVYLNGREAHAYDFGPVKNPQWKDGDDPATRVLWDTDVHAWYIPVGHLAGQPLAVTIASDAKGENNADMLWWARPSFVEDPAQQAKFLRLRDNEQLPE